MPTQPSPLNPGDVVGSTYRVDQVLALGGMSAVVAATHVRTGERVAIKCLFAQYASEVSIVRRLQREAHVAARLRSEHAVRILAAGLPADAAPLPYLVMERLEGCDLEKLLRQRSRIDAREAAGYVAQACVALAEAHALGVVHRDVKPGNLFLTHGHDGRALIKLLDFGIARFTSPNAAGDQLMLTGAEETLGTLSYMSPEQIASPNQVDARADVWSLGVTLYRLVTGVAPFRGDTMLEVAISIVGDVAPPMDAIHPDLPPGFDAVVQRCLRKQREDRYDNVTELARALAPFVADRSSERDGPRTERFSTRELTRPWGQSPTQWMSPMVSDATTRIQPRGRGRATP